MQNIIKNIFYTTSRQVLTSLISFALIVAIARFSGPKGNGLFAILLLLPSTLVNILNIEFQNNLKHKNLIFSNGIDFIHEFFNFERKINNKFLSKSVQLLGKNPLMNKIFMNVADKGLVF